jgi:hypothetical protein
MPDSDPNPEVVEVLEEALRRAKSGNYDAIVCIVAADGEANLIHHVAPVAEEMIADELREILRDLDSSPVTEPSGYTAPGSTLPS